MTQTEVRAELDEYMTDWEGSTDRALQLVENTTKWLSHISEGEYSQGDKGRLLLACFKFFESTRYLTAKYIDGD